MPVSSTDYPVPRPPFTQTQFACGHDGCVQGSMCQYPAASSRPLPDYYPKSHIKPQPARSVLILIPLYLSSPSLAHQLHPHPHHHPRSLIYEHSSKEQVGTPGDPRHDSRTDVGCRHLSNSTKATSQEADQGPADCCPQGRPPYGTGNVAGSCRSLLVVIRIVDDLPVGPSCQHPEHWEDSIRVTRPRWRHGAGN